MIYYLYIKDNIIEGYTVKKDKINDINFVEKELQEFIEELKKIGVEYAIEEPVDLEKVAMAEAMVDLNMQLEIMKEQIKKLNGVV